MVTYQLSNITTEDGPHDNITVTVPLVNMEDALDRTEHLHDIYDAAVAQTGCTVNSFSYERIYNA